MHIEYQEDFVEKLIKLNRVAKVSKGGRQFSFSALMAIGDRAGRVGYGYGKANDVSDAIRKGAQQARKNIVRVSMVANTIPHPILCQFKSARVLMKPAAPGTGIIAGGAVRTIMDLCGIHDVLGKSLGSQNSINIVKAIFDGFEKMLDARSVAFGRNKSLEDIWR